MRPERKRKQAQEFLEAKEVQLKKIQKETLKQDNNTLLGSIKSFFELGDKCLTAEDTIPIEKVYENGIFQLTDGYYTKMIAFEDINYQLALEEQRDFIFN
ncbi:conjugal transfer protein TraE, partial [Streptococcus suis]|nr:conjugal transfer protein TraE [Streptococcus suis]